MQTYPLNFIDCTLCWFSQVLLRFPWMFVLLLISLCAISLNYTINHLGVNTNTAEMLSPDLPFQKNRVRLEEAFPKESDTLLLVVEASSPEKTWQSTERLIRELRQDSLFISVYSPSISDFLKQQALFYLEPEELEDLANELTDAQPFIGYLSQNYSVKGLFTLIDHTLDEQSDGLPMDIKPLLKAINAAIKAQQNQLNQPISWQRLILGDDSVLETNHRLVFARPKLDFNELMPAEAAFMKAKQIVQAIHDDDANVRIRITGEKALEHEELESVSEGAAIAGIASLLLVCLSMFIGLRSVKLLIATFLSLIAGLVLTAGFATLAIGHLNLISIAFAILYIGLGVDFAIHLCLRYYELRLQDFATKAAIHNSIQTVGRSLLICAMTTSIGFFAFVPTDYAGVSELGIISGAGIFIGLAVSLTLLPALLQLMPINPTQKVREHKTLDNICTFPFRHARSIRVVSILSAIGACFVVTQLRFDSNPVNLRDPNSESVSTFHDLLKIKENSPFAVATLAPDLAKAQYLANQFMQLESVDQAITLASYVAEDQDAKQEIIEDLSFILGNDLDSFEQPIDHSDTRLAVVALADKIKQYLSKKNIAPDLYQNLHNLQLTLESFQQYADTNADPQMQFYQLGHNILGLLPYSLNHLNISLGSMPFTIADLPRDISEHWLSDQGVYRVVVIPAEDLNDPDALAKFVKEVQSIDDHVTGLAIADRASGAAVIKAFIQAFTGSLVAITLILWFMLRSFKETLLVIGPLMLAALLTGVVNVLLENTFNFANIIALPLLMGMGVDSGIHIVHRINSSDHASENLLQTSTARGVLFSSITTFCSFTSLSFSPHVGTASMGLLLAIGIALTLICTLIVLPAFSGKTL